VGARVREALGRGKPSAGVADGSPGVAHATVLNVSANRSRLANSMPRTGRVSRSVRMRFNGTMSPASGSSRPEPAGDSASERNYS
jgi:hypothetical protein